MSNSVKKHRAISNQFQSNIFSAIPKMNNPKTDYCQAVCSKPVSNARPPQPLPANWQNQGCQIRCKSLLDGYPCK